MDFRFTDDQLTFRDAVRDFLRKNGGDIRIQFTGQRTTAGFRPFEFCITLPLDEFFIEDRRTQAAS